MAKRKEEAEKAAREKAEKERDAQIQKNTYLISARDTSQEVEDLMHTVLISSAELNSLVSSQKEILQEEVIDRKELIDIIRDMEFNIERIHVLSSLITKAVLLCYVNLQMLIYMNIPRSFYLFSQDRLKWIA